jgi:hypothetical protein
MPKREVLPDGAVQLKGDDCSFLFRAPRPGVLFVSISGYDVGELGSAPLDEMSAVIARHRPVELFFDTTETQGLTTKVREAWTEWFAANQPAIRRVSVLTSSKLVHLAISVAKLFSRTGELMQIYSERAAFEEALLRVAR